MSSGKEFFTIKNFHKIFVVLFVLLNSSCAIQTQVSAQPGYVNNQVFYDQLSPYGEWVDNPDYGYVWIPDVDQYFSPYSTSGYWVMTDYGWTWVSDYSWGWATFHYGRWDYNNYYGWYWIPDNEWGPSWVIWRTGNGYFGWSPMRPGMNISLSFRNEYRDLDRWTFIRDRDFGRSDMNQYYVDRSNYTTIITSSRVINNTYNDRNRNTTYISGPSRADVQRVTGRKISNITIRDNDRPGQTLKSGRLNIYRPKIQNNNDRGQKPVPTRITRMQDVKPAGERNGSNQRDRVAPNNNKQREQQQQIDRRNQPQQNQEPQRQQQPQRQVEPQKQQQQQQQIERQNQQQQNREPQRQQPQRQVEPQKQQQQQQQQIERQNQQQQQSERQNQQRNLQVEKQQQEQQRQVQQQQQQQERSNQQQQVKQQREEKRQVQQQKQNEQKQTRKTREEQKQQNNDPSQNERRNR